MWDRWGIMLSTGPMGIGYKKKTLSKVIFRLYGYIGHFLKYPPYLGVG